jgi:hypothetical protein
MNKTTLLIVCCALLVIPSLAQIPQNPNACSPVGTWYGGKDYKYVMVITPVDENTFASKAEGVYDNAAFGYAAWTTWNGQLVRMKDGTYVVQEIAMFTTSHDLQPPANSFELDVVRGSIKFPNCNRIKVVYDLFGGYLDTSKKPFIDPLDINYLPPGGLVETYDRMPTKCHICGSSFAPAVSRQRH